MLTHSKSPLRASELKQNRLLKMQKQGRLRSVFLFAIIAVTWIIDATIINSGLLVTKGVLLGGLLNWLTQTIFAWFVFRFSGYHARQTIVNQLYMGLLVKWLVIILGFSLIFITIKPISTGGVLAGYLLMQIGHFISLSKA